MRQYEVTFIVDPVLSGDEIKTAANTYHTLLKDEGCEIVHVENHGLRQLAYTIRKRNSGVYHVVEFKTEDGSIIPKLELSLRRDERIIRFLSVNLDKYAVKYNEDKRNGLIGKKESVIKTQEVKTDKKVASAPKNEKATKSAPAPKAAPASNPEPAAAIKEEAPAVEATAPAVVEETTQAATPDDLTKIEGIGPKAAEILVAGGIVSFKDLSASSVSRIKELLADKGGAFAAMNPSTWGQQAQLASEGQWDELKTLQDKLDGGVEKSEEE